MYQLGDIDWEKELQILFCLRRDPGLRGKELTLKEF